MTEKEKQPLDAIKNCKYSSNASPRRLKRIVKSIPTPSSDTTFTEEEAIALMLQLGLSRDNYITLRKALSEKGKKSIIPPPIEITDRKAVIGLGALLENTALRIASDFSSDQLKKINSCDLQLICKWGCDGLSALSEYKQINTSESSSEYKSVFMASLVPLRIRKYADSDSPSTSFDDIWKNSTPGSKAFCRPISFEYIKESKTTTQDLINLGNAITGTSSTWYCYICGDKKSEFSNISKQRSINEETLQFGISPLHARIRFLEHFLHLAYDLKYRSIPENANKSANNNKELIEDEPRRAILF
ncbi:hypothetical protein CVS40_9081 [Lucilia cuprina]|nr:hypothetical protein CVS40_9081 [Lucilia cuprina]